ncbi:MAG: glycerate kinase [Anaerococcus sp.]|nr:glycerate kinase [Anaerococcus sp.]
MKRFVDTLVKESIDFCLPDKAVAREIKNLPEVKGKKILIAIGKAGYQMAKAAIDSGFVCHKGLVITKYGHSKGDLENIEIIEAGHPISDENTIRASQYAYDMTESLSEDDLVLMLISGGGSALFELPLINLEEIQDINDQLLKKGANIVEINTIRKRLSKVKGGRFANHIRPARVYNIILSDVLGNRPDMIASGPTYVDYSTSKEAQKLIDLYDLDLSTKAKSLVKEETIKDLSNTQTKISGSVDDLCKKAGEILEKEGYDVDILTSTLACEAREAGFFLAAIAKSQSKRKDKKAYIFGGETLVHLRGPGKGGRNQELAFASMRDIDGLENVRIISFSSDGSDGPTDAAGGFVDGKSFDKLKEKNLDYNHILASNNTYEGLKAIDQLIITGPTGTNVNDVSILLIN